MSSVYKVVLPEVFPYLCTDTEERIRMMVRVLISTQRKDVPAGSSFAVTVDGSVGTWNLWLSRLSANFLTRELDLPENTFIQNVGPF